jgi:hypothetical protein
LSGCDRNSSVAVVGIQRKDTGMAVTDDEEDREGRYKENYLQAESAGIDLGKTNPPGSS